MLICHDVVPEAVEVRINALREQISNLDLQHYGRSLGRVTASFGIALFPDHGESGEKLLLAADKALYRAKEAGRNRVEMASLDMKRSEAGPDHS